MNLRLGGASILFIYMMIYDVLSEIMIAVFVQLDGQTDIIKSVQ